MAIYYVGDTAGMMKPWPGPVVPTGWLQCDGSAVSRTTYSALFSIIGTAYGAGDGINTFNLPDTRGRVLVGMGTNTDVSSLGKNDGSTLANRSPKHVHAVPNGTVPDEGNNVFATSARGNTSSAGPAYLVVLHIIKY